MAEDVMASRTLMDYVVDFFSENEHTLRQRIGGLTAGLGAAGLGSSFDYSLLDEGLLFSGGIAFSYTLLRIGGDLYRRLLKASAPER
jgi:hypothetical protein